MREIVLDTETTGFDPASGDRIVEIGCVELDNHLPTGKDFHCYIDPGRDMPQSAFEVHGLSAEFLAGKPKFAEICDDFLDFIKSDPLIIHNAGFDMKFLNAELKWARREPLLMAQAVDTVSLARKKYPGAQASLDALCRRFGVDNSAREKHGALLDAQILAEVYLELIGGREPGLGLGMGERADDQSTAGPATRPTPLPDRVSEEERAAHSQFIANIKDALWNRFDNVK